jgi:type I restriction enzyme S subunit
MGEQEAAISLIDEFLSQANGAVASTRSSEKAALALRQAILKQAFSGALVPQDSTDEPAAMLLERMAAKRASTNTGAAKSGRKKKSA